MLNTKRLLRANFIATFAALLVLIFASRAFAADINFTKPDGTEVLGESPDFAVDRFADPWDMSKRTDISFGQYTNQLSNIGWAGGVFSARTTGTDPAFHPLFPGYEGVVFNGRDGFINRIDTKKYKRFSVRMYSSRATSAQLFWFYNQVWTDYGTQVFHVDPGWHTYVLDLPASGKWTGSPMGLRFDPTALSGVDFKIDWMRLYRDPGRRVQVAWTDARPRGSSDLYLDVDTNPDNDNMDLLKSGPSESAGSYTWDPSAYQPGTYYFYLKKPGQPGVYSKGVTINRPPLITIIDPDETGGRDYATDVSGDPWDMNQRSDLWYWDGVKDVTFSRGVMGGTPTHGDGYFHLRVPRPIDTDKYHRLTFRFRYDGPFDYGAGTMSRFIWSPDHHTIGLFQTINDIVTYPTWQTYTIDLKKASMDGGSIGWNGMMNDLRFDPLEWQAQWRFYVDYIRLAADDRANRSFLIKWKDDRKYRRPTRVSFYYDTNRKGYNGRVIVKGRDQVAGVNKYRWNTRAVRPGLYYVYAVANDGVSVSKRYSSGPIRISH